MSQPTMPAPLGSIREVGILHSEQRSLSSAVSEQQYEIAIWLPESYSSSTKAYPAIYLLDSNMLFGAAVSLLLPLTWGTPPELPECLIVGIGYKIKTYDDWLQRRTQNFFAGAPQFLSFIRSELIPFVDGNYRTDPTNRCLYGHSGGGWFVWHTLFHEPELFKRYVAGSPGMGSEVTAWEQAFADRRGDLPARLAVVVGALEIDQVTAIRDFCERLKHRQYTGFDVKLMVMEAADHATVIPQQMMRGLPTVFA